MMEKFYYLLVFLSSSVFCLGIRIFLKRPFFHFCESAVSQLDTIADIAITEDNKERILIIKLKRLIINSASLIFFLILILAISILPTYIYLSLSKPKNVDFHSIYFYLCMFAGSVFLFLHRKNTSDYSYWSRLLHTIILNNYNIAKRLYKIERKRHISTECIDNKRFIIVSGLARGGTTALTNLLFESKCFHSISYANMPFLMAPDLWSKIYKPKNKKLKERSHGDKIVFGESSIEA